MNDSHYLVLSIGSNYGDRHGNVTAALSMLEELLERSESSSIYETEAIGKSKGGSPYMNAVISGVYFGNIEELNNRLKKYEKECGRDENARRSGNVPIDLDIVICDKEILRQRDFSSVYFIKGYKEILQ